MANKLRIIGGEWRSRIITFDDHPGLRPTPQRVRETLFNWLQPYIIGSRCMDLFAGSGALGLEAASRGARQVVQVDSNAQVCQAIQSNIDRLNAQQVQVKHQSVASFLNDPAEAFDIIFLDPPFADDLIEATCQQLEQNGWMKPGALCYIEAPVNRNLQQLPDTWQCLKSKKAGEVAYHLFTRKLSN